MASSSASANTAPQAPAFTLPNLTHFTSIKLEGPNYLAWTTQLAPILKTHDLMGIVDGSEPCPPQFLLGDDGKEISNPAHSIWQKKDQYVLSWINVHLSELVLSTIYGLQTSQQVWTSLATKFASSTRSHVSHLKRQLQSLRQGSKSCSEYLKNAQSLSNQLAAIGKPIDDEDLISYIISGLNPSFNAFVTVFSMTSKDKAPSFPDFQDELLSHEMLLHQQQEITSENSNFALVMQKQSKPFKPGTPNYNRKFKSNPFNRFSSRSGPSKNFIQSGGSSAPQQQAPSPQQGFSFSNSNRVPCQICGKTSHQALDCFHRMDYSFQGRHPPAQLSAMVVHLNSEIEDQQWLADSGANAHITNELEHLSIQQPFKGNDSVTVGNGAGLQIENTGSTILNSENYKFHLNNVLHCPHAATKLLSIQKFCQDNSCYFILTTSHYFVKDIRTHAILLEGRSEHGLFPLRFRSLPFMNNNKSFPIYTAFLGLKTTPDVWHSRLGHSSFSIVDHVIKAYNLPTSSNKINKIPFCDFCPLGKSKQLPFSSSTLVSTGPLELIHTDLWTSPIPSMSGCKYYIVFIDDFSRYTWMYPLHYKSEAYDNFVKFKLLTEN
jgi:hypothetical protein